MTEKPYTPADVQAVALAVARTLGVDPFAGSDEVARAALDALVAAGWHPRPLDADGNRPDDCGHCTLLPTVNGWVRAKQSACPAHGDPLARQIAETMEVAAELAEERTTADEMTRAVKRLVGERDDALAEARGARSDYEQLKGFNAELAAERDRLQRELDQIRRGDKLARPR